MLLRPKSALRPYQNRLATKFFEHDGHIAVLPMGGGKTISALTAIQELLDEKVIRHALVLAPKRVATLVWPEEIQSWAHTAGLNYAVLTGGPDKRAAALAAAPYRDLTICGIDNVQWLIEQIKDLPADHPIFDRLVIDEISRMRNPTSKRGKAIKQIMARFRGIWGLTGTPRPNGFEDLFNPYTIVSKAEIWGPSFYKWRERYFYTTDWNGYDWSVLPGADARLLADASHWSTTLADADMPELPELTVVEHKVKLPAEARRVYRQMERDLFSDIPVDPARWTPDVVIAVNAAVGSGKLAQIAQGFLYDTDGDGERSAVQLHEVKLDWLTEIVDNLAGEPALIVYEFQEDLARLRETFGHDLPNIGAGTSDHAAAQHVRAWNEGRIPLMALHPASAGHGLNLQAGGRQMLWLGLTWSAELWEQTIKRLHRPGQGHHCFVHICIAEATVDEVKRARVVDKVTAAEAFRRYLKTI